MKKLIIICSLLLMVAFINSCEKDSVTTKEIESFDKESTDAILNVNQQYYTKDIPAATVELINYSKSFGSGISNKTVDGCDTPLTPTSLEANLRVLESITETKTACLSGVPPKGDVLFCMDLTGSMGVRLENLKVNSINIMNAIGSSIPDSEFGLISHMDYPAFYSSCGYTAYYAIAPDYAYSMDQSITSNTTNVSNAIQGLNLGYGSDFPEDYERALFETYSDPTILWRSGAARIAVMMLDAIPHDCAVYSLGTTGSDPGRDGVMGNEDDIDMDAVITEMANQNIKLIVLNSGDPYYQPIWEHYANLTGGAVFQLNYDGTIPGGALIEDVITGLIEESVASVSSLTLEANPASYSSWVTSAPSSYTDIDLEFSQELEFDLTITVPAGTADGLYEFEVDLVGDGAVYGTQTVAITVFSDSDGDGCLDVEDEVVDSNMEVTIEIDFCDYGVENRMIPGVPCGTMMSDMIDDLEVDTTYKNHGAFIKAMAKLVNSWYDEGLITLSEKDLIMMCAGESSIGDK